MIKLLISQEQIPWGQLHQIVCAMGDLGYTCTVSDNGMLIFESQSIKVEVKKE